LAYWLGCSGQEHFIAYSAANAAQAHTNAGFRSGKSTPLRRTGLVTDLQYYPGPP